MRVALYPRVSGHEQEDNYSVPEQIKRMKAYCEARGWMVYKIYTDSGYTGSNLIRPGLQQLIRDAELQKIDMVLVYKLDRLSRSQKDTLYLIEDVFDKHNVFFTSITENFDTSTPTGKAFLGILAVFAQFEREQIRERTMIGKDSRAKEGKWHGSKWVPIGYEYTDGNLIPNDYEVMQINEIADMFIDRVPVRTIATIVTNKGYKHKYGEWDAKTIKRVLINKTNLGMIKHRDKYYPGEHPAIITQEKYDAIEAINNERKEKHGTTYKPFSSLLGGMIYCKHCGGKYCRQGNGNGTYYYSCYSRNKSQKKMIKDPNCKNKNYRMLDLDCKIIEEITRLSLNPEYIEQVRDHKPEHDIAGKIKTIKAEIESIHSQISNLMDLYSLGNMPLDVINKKVTDLNATKMALEKELDSLNAPDTRNDELTNEQIQNTAGLINDKDLTLGEKRAVVQSLIYYIEIDDENVYIHWKF